MRTFSIKNPNADNPVLPETKTKRIPVRVNDRTIIMVPEGADIEAHKKKYQEHETSVPGWIPWW